MKKLILVGMLLLLMTGCGNKEYHTITASKAKEMMNEDTVILDVRTESEYEVSHIKDAINVPLDKINNIETQLTDKKQTILVYCQSGNRSKDAAQKLVELGYQNVYNFGGLSDWTYGIVSSLKEQAELSLKALIQAIEMTYLESFLSEEIQLPLSITCNGEACIYNQNKEIPLSKGIVPTTAKLTLNQEGKIEPTTEIVIKGYQCSILENETVTCN